METNREANLANLMDTTSETNARAETITKPNHPSVAALRLLRDWLPVEFNKLWVSIVCFIIEISFSVTPSLESGQSKTIWALLILLIGWVLFTLSQDDLEKYPVYGILIFDAWFLYGLLPWGVSTYVIPQYIIAGASVILTFLFFMSGEVGDLASGYIFFAQMLCLIYPVKLSARIEPAELWVQVLFFALGWCTYLLVTRALHQKVKFENILMANLPLLRLQGAAVLLYMVLLESSLAFQCYMVKPLTAGAPTSLQNQRGGASLNPFDDDYDDGEVDPESQQGQLQEDAPLLQEPTPPIPRPTPRHVAAAAPKSRFKIPTMVQTRAPPVSFFRLSPVYHHQQQQKAVSPSVNILPTPVAEIERLGGSHLKDVYGGKQ